MLSKRSTDNLVGVHPDLMLLFAEVNKIIPIEIIEGKRSPERQAELVKKGLSKKLDGKHTAEPFALAVDVCPLPIDFKDTNRFYYLMGIVRAVAHDMNIKIRMGGDWNGNHQFKDQTFNDLVHYELA